MLKIILEINFSINLLFFFKIPFSFANFYHLVNVLSFFGIGLCLGKIVFILGKFISKALF